MSFRTGLSGLHAAQADLDVTAHNIANASTVGFKTSRAEFVDVFAVSYAGIGALTPGSGVRVSNLAQQFQQGNIEYTDNNLDLGIQGNGFFVVEDTNGRFYTRQGNFRVDKDGYVENIFRQRLQVFPPDGLGGYNTGVLGDLQLSAGLGAPAATTQVNTLLNLDASEPVIAAVLNPALPATYNHTTALTVYDSLGQTHVMSLYFQRTGLVPATWDVYPYLDGNAPDLTAFSTDTVQFDTNGNMTLVNGAAVPPTLGNNIGWLAATVGTGSSPLGLNIDYGSMTQYGSPFDISVLSQDGYTTGRLSSIDIDDTGIVFARYTNGNALDMGKVALASFPNPQGLQNLGDSLWGDTYAAGDVIFGQPGSSSFGLIQSGALEASTVDLADQLVNMIIAQRNFQASAQVITTNDTITQTIINMR